MKKGLVLLPAILMMSFVVLGIGLTGLLIVFTLNRSNYAIKLSTTALSISQAGIHDANIKIIRNPNWYPVGCNSSLPLNDSNKTYLLIVGSNNVYVCVEKTGNKYTVNSLGKVLNQSKQLKAVFDTDNVTNQIRLESINEVQF